MNYIYHLKPDPMEGHQLIPLNLMDKESDLFKDHARKYIGREGLMKVMIPIINCKWNDVVQFSSLDPQVIVNELAKIDMDLKLFRTEYYKVPIETILQRYEGVVFDRKNPLMGSYKINSEDVAELKSYTELFKIPKETIEYWKRMKEKGGKMLWFPFIPHIFIKGIIDVSDFEICQLTIEK